MLTIDEVRDLAFQLSVRDREALANDLLVSLDEGEADTGADAAWAEEIERRAEAYARGEVQAEDWEISLARARQQLRESQQS